MNRRLSGTPAEAVQDTVISEDSILNKITEHLSDHVFDGEQMYAYLEAFAHKHHMEETLRALPFAWEKHRNQFRCGKERIPYICHPLMVACHALALELWEDDLIAAAILHDVCEDCGVAPADLPVGKEVQEIVRILTKDPSPRGRTFAGQQDYYYNISCSRIATLVKLLDRCNNISSMTSGFSRERMIYYIKDTERWVYPLFKSAKTKYPQHRSQIFLIRYHMTSMIDSIRSQLSSGPGLGETEKANA